MSEVVGFDGCMINHPIHREVALLVASRPERAVLEVLNLVPSGISFELADKLFQGLTKLSPTKLVTTLSACNNIRAKR